MQESKELFLTAKQCAKRYNISERHFRRMVDNGTMPKPMKLGRCSRWVIKVLEEYESRKIQKILKTSAGNSVSMRYSK